MVSPAKTTVTHHTPLLPTFNPTTPHGCHIRGAVGPLRIPATLPDKTAEKSRTEP